MNKGKCNLKNDLEAMEEHGKLEKNDFVVRPLKMIKTVLISEQGQTQTVAHFHYLHQGFAHGPHWVM